MPSRALARLAEGVRDGDANAIADTLSRVEDVRAEALAEQRELLLALERETRREHTFVFLTGSPGA